MKKALLGLVLFSMTSCTYDNVYLNREEDKNEAQKITEKLYYFLQQNNKDDAYKLFGNTFFEVTSKDQLSKIIEMAKKEYGEIQNDSLSAWQSQVIKGSHPDSNYEMTYLVKRTHGSTKEVITLQKERDTIKIIGYRVNF